MDHPPALIGRSGNWFEFDHEGQPFVLWIDERPDSLQDIIMRTGNFYEVEALQLIRVTLPAKARIVDVGANIGNHAIYFDRVCGADKVFVIEPNADVLVDLKANAAANACEAIDLTTTGFAAGAETGVGKLVISPSDDAIRNRGGISVTQDARVAGQDVAIRRLDDLDLGRIDFLKIDVEGSALAVLEGARALLARSRPSIFVEIDVPDLPSFTGWIRDNGYEVTAAFEYHLGIVNFLLISGPRAAGDGAGMAAQPAGAIGMQWSAMFAQKHRADRCEDTLAIATAAMRHADARATEAEGRVLQHAADLRDALARVEEAKSLQKTFPTALNRSSKRHHSLWQQLFFHASGKPRKIVRKLFFHSAGRPRGAFRTYVVHSDGRPRDAFYRWMTSTEYLAMPDVVGAGQRRFLAREALPASCDVPVAARHNAGSKRVLYIDSDYPDPIRDAGSVNTINYITWFRALGYEVVFLSTRFNADKKAERPVVAAGAGILHLSGEQAVTDYLRDEAHAFGLFFLSRVHCGGRFLEACRRGNPQADIIFDTVDLHHVREDREARLRQDREAMFRAKTVLERELYLASQSDLTIVVSSVEKEILTKAVPGAAIGEMPLFRKLPAIVPDFTNRRGIGFVGGYAHSPNVDAVRYFLEAVWPHVHLVDPEIQFEIAGLGLPDEIARALPSGVIYRGQVADLEGWLGRLRLTVAPLRYGAGAKGKVASSIVNGVPVVGTRIAFEGMGLGPDATVAADHPADMAREILRLHSDRTAWDALSRGAQSFATANLSPEAGQSHFAAQLSALPSASPGSHYRSRT
ncbi:MAG: FkbM family methyltransferase [Planctomycetia bacterium]|nr:FkbM family methyltransferase [Planctomycetia bacterium]